MEQHEEKRVRQVDRVVQRRIEKRMGLQVDGQDKAFDPAFRRALPDSRRGDRRDRQVRQNRFEGAVEFDSYAQQGEMVVIGQRGVSTSQQIRFEVVRDHYIGVYLLFLHGVARRLGVCVAGRYAGSRNRRDGARDLPGGGRLVEVDDADRDIFHLSAAEDRGHEQNAEQGQRDAYPEVKPSGYHSV